LPFAHSLLEREVHLAVELPAAAPAPDAQEEVDEEEEEDDTACGEDTDDDGFVLEESVWGGEVNICTQRGRMERTTTSQNLRLSWEKVLREWSWEGRLH
jgi:hypothetical protein